MTPRHVDELWDRLRAQVDPGSLRWLEDAAGRVRRDPRALAAVFPAVGRRVGRQRLRPAPAGPGPGEPDTPAPAGATSERRPGPDEAGGGIPPADRTCGERRPAGPGEAGGGGSAVHEWTVDDAGRAVLLVAAGDQVWEEIEDLYRFGDAAERRGALRALHLLPLPAGAKPPDRNGTRITGDRGLRLVDDAVRTNDPRLLAAALGPYAVERLSDEAFDQAILKCVFVGVPLAGLEGLAERATPGLSRMLAAYALERVAAGRDVPPDVWPLIELHPPADELTALEAELDHPVESRRQAAAAALRQRAAHQR